MTLGELLKQKIELDRAIKRAQILEQLAKVPVTPRMMWKREELEAKLRNI